MVMVCRCRFVFGSCLFLVFPIEIVQQHQGTTLDRDRPYAEPFALRLHARCMLFGKDFSSAKAQYFRTFVYVYFTNDPLGNAYLRLILFLPRLRGDRVFNSAFHVPGLDPLGMAFPTMYSSNPLCHPLCHAQSNSSFHMPNLGMSAWCCCWWGQQTPDAVIITL